MTSLLAEKEWRVIPEEETRSGPMQMALEEIAAETARNGGPRTVRVYQWKPSTLSLGYRQASETVDWEFCDRQSIEVTRRPTGGGGIYHDTTGDISYSIIAPSEELPQDVMESYHLLCQPVLEAFNKMNIAADFAEKEYPAIHEPACYLRGVNPAHDIVVDGQKISGNAQNRQQETVIQHGSISYELTPETQLGCFANPETSAKAYRDRVTSINEQVGLTRENAVRTLKETLTAWTDASQGKWSDEEIAKAKELAETKYRSDAWVKDRSDPTEIS